VPGLWSIAGLLALACGTLGPTSVVFFVSIVFVLILFLLDRDAVVTSITQVWRNCNWNLRRLGRRAAPGFGDEENWRVGSLFYVPDKARGGVSV
jgi:hypothetical protein